MTNEERRFLKENIKTYKARILKSLMVQEVAELLYINDLELNNTNELNLISSAYLLGFMRGKEGKKYNKEKYNL